MFWLNLLHQRWMFMPALHLLSLSFSNYFTAFLLSYRQGPGKNLLPWKLWYNLCTQCEKFSVFWLVFFKRENNWSIAAELCCSLLFCAALPKWAAFGVWPVALQMCLTSPPFSAITGWRHKIFPPSLKQAGSVHLPRVYQQIQWLCKLLVIPKV